MVNARYLIAATVRWTEVMEKPSPSLSMTTSDLLANCSGTKFAMPSSKGSERPMEGKARFVFPVVITAIIVFVVSGAVTNIGWRNDFVIRWWSAFAIGWPIAASTAYLAMPFARSLTQRIVAAIERTV
jgi:Protein of unknown function (DUF2798)